jgi:N-acetylglucosamine-6-sulfatase
MEETRHGPQRQARRRRGTVLLLSLLSLLVAAAVFIKTGPHPLHQPALSPVAATPSGVRPNLLVIMVDDLDQPTFDLMLRSGWLPNIQRHIADAGVRFDNSYVSDAVCCPSRATYFTGQYPQNHGILSVTKGVAYWYLAAENREDRALGVLMQQAGYFTGHIGKYLNGYGMFSDAAHVPRGYDQWYGLLDPSTYDLFDYKVNRSIAASGRTELREIHADPRTGAGYQTDQLGDWALQFLRDARGSGKPFYLTLKPVAPHIETQSFRDDPALGYRATFREYIRPAPRHECLVRAYLPQYVAPAQPGSWCDRRLPDTLAYLATRPSFNRIDDDKHPRLVKVLQPLSVANGDIGALQRQHQMRMAAMLAVDDVVGRVIDALRENGQLDDSLVLFTSDNGYFFGEHGLNSKLLPYEESIRVPLLVRPPRGLRTAVQQTAIALNNDLAPTLADYAGARPLRDSDVFDGRSLRALIDGDGDPVPAASRRQFMVEHYIEATTMELAADFPLYHQLSEVATQFLGKLAGFELGALGNLSYPAYKAVRRQAPGDNWLYVQWYRERSNRPQVLDDARWHVDFEELYDLDRDPYQSVNLVPLLQDADYRRAADAMAAMKRDLDALKRCKGASCRDVEDR